jgi:non-heme chloroperoxidase
MRRHLLGRMTRSQDGFVLTRDGVRLHYTDEGTGRAVVFVHGWQSAAAFWQRQADAITPGTRVICYDQRGHGRSDNSASGATVPALAHDLRELLATLDIRNAVLVGHAMGCSVIWAYLTMFGSGRVDRVAFVEPSPAILIDPLWDERTIDSTGAMLTEMQLMVLANTLADPTNRELGIRHTVVKLASPDCDDHQIEELVGWGTRVDAAFGSALLLDHARRDWRSAIEGLSLPTLLVAGRDSVVPARASRWVAQAIPGARLVLIEGGSHLLTIERSLQFNPILRDFLARASIRRGHVSAPHAIAGVPA